MATDIATLGIKVENGDVVKATTSLNSMTVAGGKTEAATTRLTRRMALLEIEARQMDTAMSKSALTISGLAMKMGATEAAAGKLAGALSAVGVATAAIAAVAFIGHKTIEETEAAQAAMAQLEAAFKSTGGAAGRSVEQMDALSIALQKTTTFSDEAVKGAETMLLAFNKIKGTEFDRATKTAADLAARMGTDLSDAALKVGKALQDPEHGLAQLRKSGISFSDSQIAVVKALYETGQTAKGMNMILDEMDKKFGGAAEAARDTLGGALKGLHNAWGDLFEVTKGGSNGMVQFINAITKAIEHLGPIMDKFARDTVIMFRTMSIDLSKGLSNFLREREKIIAEANAPAKIAPVGSSPEDLLELNKRAEKFRETLAAMDLEIARQRALNAVIGASSATIALLNNAYDARAERTKNAIDHTAQETAALNKRTDAMLAAKDAAVLEAAAMANRKQVTDTQHGDANAVRDARQALELAGLSEEAAAQRRIDMQAENDLAEARLRFAVMTKDLDKERADVAAGILQREQDIYASTAARVEKTRELGHVTAAVSAEMDKQKKAEEDAAREQQRRDRERLRVVTGTVDQAITDALNGKNPLPGLAANIKAAVIHAFSEALAQKFLASKFAEMLGIGVEAAAKRNDVAANKMVDASVRFLNAANIMMGLPTVGTPGTTPPPQTSGMAGLIQKYAAPVIASAIAGYATGQAVTSTSHGAVGNYARGALGGAASGAIAGGAIAGAPGAIVGAVVGFVSGLFGANKAMKEAAKAAEEMRKALALNIADLRAVVAHDDLGQAIAQVEANREQLRKQIEDAYSGGGRNSDTVRERNKQLAEMNKLEDERIQQLKEEAAAIIQQRQDDLDVRTLRNQGHQHEADILAKQKEDAREYADAVKNHMSDAYLAQLKWNQSVEEAAVAAGTAANAINGLTTALHNAPVGEKIERYTYQYGTPSPRNGFTPMQPTWPQIPNANPQLSRSSSATFTGDIIVKIDGSKSPDETAKSVAQVFRRMKIAANGPQSSGSAFMDQLLA